MPLMIPGAPQFSKYESNINASPNQFMGTNVTNGATPHTKNTTFTQLIAATTFDAQCVLVTVGSTAVSNANSSTLLDIAIGASTAETVIIPDLCAGWAQDSGTAPGGRHYIFPLYIPSGSRVSARTQTVRTTGGPFVLVQLFGGPRNPDRWWYG